MLWFQLALICVISCVSFHYFILVLPSLPLGFHLFSSPVMKQLLDWRCRTTDNVPFLPSWHLCPFGHHDSSERDLAVKGCMVKVKRRYAGESIRALLVIIPSIFVNISGVRKQHITHNFLCLPLYIPSYLKRLTLQFFFYYK